MINLLSKTDDFIKMINLLNKTYDFQKNMINLLIKMERCNFWKHESKNLLCWQGLVLLDWCWQVRTCPNHDFWSNLTRFGFKIRFLTSFLNDSAWFLLEKLIKHVILTKNPKNTSKNQKNINALNCPPRGGRGPCTWARSLVQEIVFFVSLRVLMRCESAL